MCEDFCNTTPALRKHLFLPLPCVPFLAFHVINGSQFHHHAPAEVCMTVE